MRISIFLLLLCGGPLTLAGCDDDSGSVGETDSQDAVAIDAGMDQEVAELDAEPDVALPDAAVPDAALPTNFQIFFAEEATDVVGEGGESFPPIAQSNDFFAFPREVTNHPFYFGFNPTVGAATTAEEPWQQLEINRMWGVQGTQLPYAHDLQVSITDDRSFNVKITYRAELQLNANVRTQFDDDQLDGVSCSYSGEIPLEVNGQALEDLHVVNGVEEITVLYLTRTEGRCIREAWIMIYQLERDFPNPLAP